MKRVFRLLKIRDKSQKDLADYCGVTKGAVTNWKRGGKITYHHARLIAKFFDNAIEVEEIMPEHKRRKAG